MVGGAEGGRGEGRGGAGGAVRAGGDVVEQGARGLERHRWILDEMQELGAELGIARGRENKTETGRLPWFPAHQRGAAKCGAGGESTATGRLLRVRRLSA